MLHYSRLWKKIQRKEKQSPQELEFLRCLPLSVKESLLKDEVNAILFEDVWPDSLLENLKDYFEEE